MNTKNIDLGFIKLELPQMLIDQAENALRTIDIDLEKFYQEAKLDIVDPLALILKDFIKVITEDNEEEY